ncbi:proline/betaine transporter [Plautia stali symbiont]|nr:proline/betaine transporter [Plautia stali symbiont]
MVVAVVGLVTSLYMKETANKPLRGETPAASDLEEAREILQEHHDNIEQKIEDIDEEIARLEAKRKNLVQQLRDINE